ncbi:uncharacterized protein LOC106752970 [Vigna radiata var. radiata]|uniref:Uncharacterized protein LOC106752970 n=1 Tax=Vigna radiata var. radiata TaxID=3916 RepID=A0A1S3T8Z3_VIGRR|nr:uncharacterized protein LOC106752970 [Vigna radiata var. radiata]
MNAKWLSQEIDKSLIDNPNLKVQDIRSKALRKWNTNVSISKARRAKLIASRQLEVDYKEQFKMMYDYGHEVLRPIVCLDGCFMKGQFKGEVFTAVGRDPNEQMLPLAYAVVEVENKETWTWFLQILIEHLRGNEVCGRCTWMSDQQKVLVKIALHSWSARKIFEVSHSSAIDNKFKVDLDTHDCSCRKWLISGIPCCHAIAAMNYSSLDAEDFIPTCFRRSTYEEVYASIIYPVNGHLLWERTPYHDVLPPIKRKLPGRPKKKRRLEAWELTKDDTQMHVGGHIKKCSICRQRGHNKNNCPLCPQPTETTENQPSQPSPSTQSSGSSQEQPST